MRFVSTAGESEPAGAAEAVWRGLAPDGGLYVPEEVPRLDAGRWEELLGEGDVADLAVAMLSPYLGEILDRGELRSLAADALDFPLPLSRLGDGPDAPFLLELFHGPTLAFKDVGARFLARLLPRLRPPREEGSGDGPVTVLVATSGDTGGAVARAFHGVEGTRVVVLYPEGQVSPRQERQFATLGGNVTSASVAGTFDDCQRLAKEAFADRELSRAQALTSANSINLGRLLPQMVYYAWGAAQLLRLERRLQEGAPDAARPVTPASVAPHFVVPSGNFGNLTAGLLAAAMGLPCRRFGAACNANDVVPELLETGRFRPRPSVSTLANAMDVGDPSNLARIRWLFADDLEALRRAVVAASFSDDAIRGAIREVHGVTREPQGGTGRVIDPHTAVGWLAWRRLTEEGEIGGPAVILATAHPAKFAEVVEPVLGEDIPLPPALAECMDKPLLSVEIPPRLEALAEVLE